MSTYPSGYGEPGVRRGAGYGGYQPYLTRPQHLTPSKELGQQWRAVRGPDIKGWDLVNHANEKIGTVDDVLVDTDTGHAVFALVRIGGAMGMGGRKTLIPIDLLTINEPDKKVVSPLSPEALQNAPEYNDDVADFGPFYEYWQRWWGPRPGQTGLTATPGSEAAMGEQGLSDEPVLFWGEVTEETVIFPEDIEGEGEEPTPEP